MSFIDLATLALHRRNEMEARINMFLEKCDNAIQNIEKLKMQARGFVNCLNCEPSDLKEQFLSCMGQLDEFTYLITEFNLNVGKIIDPTNNVGYLPVQDMLIPVRALPQPPLENLDNLIDTLSEPQPSTSRACSNQCPPEKLKKKKIPKEEQLLINFSSSSCSSESMTHNKTEVNEKQVQCELVNDIKNMAINDESSLDEYNLPPQKILEVDQVYPATIMHVDGLTFWIITETVQEVCNMFTQMTDYYKKNSVELSLEQVMCLTHCAIYAEEESCYYRGFFIKLSEEDMSVAEVFLLDTGEIKTTPTECIQPLAKNFADIPPYARCCHLVGVEIGAQSKEVIEKQQQILSEFRGIQCKIKVDDNSSESLGVYAILENGNSINDLLLQQGVPDSVELEACPDNTASSGLQELNDADFDITQCPEYEDPVEAVTGYSNRDEIDICKHYKGPPEKTCFKGARCTKRHVLKHPDGWTLDRVPVPARCPVPLLPEPNTWVQVHVTHVAYYDHIYVHLVTGPDQNQAPPSFGVMLPPTSLNALVQDMNSPASRCAYKPLKMIPAEGELVAALYPSDDQWYRARVLTVMRADQNVEVLYIDYGNIVWVREDAVRALEPRWLALPAQAVRCALAGVRAPPAASHHTVRAARDALRDLAANRTLDAHVIARDYDEITVALFDEHGNNIAEQLAKTPYVKLTNYSVIHDNEVRQKVVVP